MVGGGRRAEHLGQRRQLAVGRVVAGDHAAGQQGGVEDLERRPGASLDARRSGAGTRRRRARCGPPARSRPRTRGRPAARPRSVGASATIELVMPVSTAMNGGMAVWGLTRVWNSPRTSPPRTLTAPISVIIEPAAAEPPVVSRSTTQKVMLAQRPAELVESTLRLPARPDIVVGNLADARAAEEPHVPEGRRARRHSPAGRAQYPCSATTDVRSSHGPSQPRGGRPSSQPGPSRVRPALAVRRLRQPDALRRRVVPAYRGVLARRPGRRRRRRGHRGAGARPSSPSPAAGADGPTRSSSCPAPCDQRRGRLSRDLPWPVNQSDRTPDPARARTTTWPACPRSCGRAWWRSWPTSCPRCAGLPAAVRRVAEFAPNRRARLGGSAIVEALLDDELRERVAVQVAARPGREDDRADAAARAWLSRGEGWTDAVEQAESTGGADVREAEREAAELARLRDRVEAAEQALRDARAKARGPGRGVQGGERDAAPQAGGVPVDRAPGARDRRGGAGSRRGGPGPRRRAGGHPGQGAAQAARQGRAARG